jgi:tetratricopeptide (TPR) repeat protein
MSNWKPQNEAVWAQIDFVFSDPESTSLAWITCDSFRHVQTLVATFRAHFPNAQHLDHRITGFEGSNFTQYFQNQLPTEFMQPSSEAKFLHVFGLESHVGLGLAQPYSGLFSALNLEREIMFLRFPFNIVFWTDSYSQIKAQSLAPDFWDWLTDKFHFEAPEEVAKAELEWMMEEKNYVQPEKRAELYHQISQQIGKLGNHDGSERLSLLEAIAYNYQALQDFNRAAYYREEVLKMRDLLLPQQVAFHLNELGVVYSNLGQSQRALKAYQDSLVTYSEIGDKEGGSISLNNLATIAIQQGDFPKALDYLQRSLKIILELGDRKVEGTTLNNLSQVYQEQGDFLKALGYLEQSLLIRQEIKDRSGESVVLGNISQVYYAQGDFQKAIGYLEMSLKISLEIGNRVGVGLALHNLGAFADDKDEYFTAIPYFYKAATIFRSLGSRMEKSVVERLTKIQQKLGPEAYQAILAQIPQDEDPFDLSSLPQIQVD